MSWQSTASDSTASDNAYQALTEGVDDARWAYGTGFVDPLAGVRTTVPPGVDPGDLATYCLMLGDDALICSQRLQEWVARAPELEEDVALANIALDLLGQARMLLSRAHAAAPELTPPTAQGIAGEDALAYFREERAFRNVRLTEADNGDFACTIAKLLAFTAWRLPLLQGLSTSTDPVLAAIAAKGVKEAIYHRDHAAQWTVRLGDGTPYSTERMQAGLETVWPLVGELFDCHPVERRLLSRGVAVDPATLRSEFDSVLGRVLAAAGLAHPQSRPLAGVNAGKGRDGVHTEAFGYLLAEMQSLARAHPEATW
jgi:ring-1,2-phenylacetyl-CoA epoxidase subunit PaaC